MTYEEIICDANNLYKAYLASVKGSKWKESSQRFMVDYLTYIFQILDRLKNRDLINDRTDTFELRERGRVRAITSIQTRGRIVRHVLCDEVIIPAVRKKIIYDNGASLKGRGLSFSRKRFEIHLRKFVKECNGNGFILLGDFSKYYDNILHDVAKEQFLELLDYDEFVRWLLDLIFTAFEVDVSYMTDEEYAHCLESTFNKLEYRLSQKRPLDGSKMMKKSVNIGDQLSQIVGVYHPHEIDNFVKYVKRIKYYGRYNDDWYVMSQSEDELISLLNSIREIAKGLGIHLNARKTRIIDLSKPFKYLQIQYSVVNGKIHKKLSSKRINAMRRKIRKLSVKVISGEIPYENAESTFKSWMGSFYKLLTKTQRKNMVSLFEGLFNRKITIRKKKMIINEV